MKAYLSVIDRRRLGVELEDGIKPVPIDQVNRVLMYTKF